MLTVAFAAHFEAPARARLEADCALIAAAEEAIVARLAEADVLVSMAFTRRMAAEAKRLKLVQVPGAGLDRIDRAALPAGVWLASAYGHEAGIAEYAMAVIVENAARIARGEPPVNLVATGA